MAEMLIDGAKLDACNTAEADAIRAKTGGSSPIPYDYANNKGFADAIAAISGGVPLNGAIMNSGSFTVASPVGGTISINHGLSKTPFMVIVMPTENALISAKRNLGGVGIACKVAINKFYVGVRFYSNDDNPAYTHNPNSEPNESPDTTYIHGFTSTKFDFTASSSFPPIAAEYQWVAFAFKETR